MRVLSFSCLCSTYCIVNHLLSTKFKFSCYNALSQYSIDYDAYMIGLVFGDGFSVVEAIDQQCPCSAIILDAFLLLLFSFLCLKLLFMLTRSLSLSLSGCELFYCLVYSEFLLSLDI